MALPFRAAVKHVDDAAPFPRLHLGERRSREADRGEQLQIEVLLPDFVGNGFERPIGMGAGVVEQDVDPAKLLFGGGKDAGAIFGLADVAGDGDGLALALARQRLARALQHVGRRATMATLAPARMKLVAAASRCPCCRR